MRKILLFFAIVISANTFVDCTRKRSCKCSKNNEKWDPCPPSCPPEMTCEQYLSGIELACPMNAIKTPCKPAYRCIEGYVRNNNGKCVKPTECCEDPNAELVTCPSACPLTCEKRSPTVCNKMCLLRGCQCKEGHLLHNGKCILPAECPATTTCGTNEVYNECPGYCTFENDCMMYTGIVRDCAAPPPDYQCSPRCDCAPDFVRIGADCVSPSLCPNSTCFRKNEIFTTCGSCDGICANPHPICIAACTIGCFCREGYVRDVSGDCILPYDCPEDTVCTGPNELFNRCGSCDATCDEPNKICASAVCNTGCFCQPGYVRDRRNVCILKAECPSSNVICGTNEVANICPGYCTFEDTCPTKYGGLINECAAPPIDYQCVPRCDCAPDFVRIGEQCVSPEFCPNSTCSRGNEFFTTCGGCDGSCAEPNPVCAAVCRTGCFCLPGHVRDGAGCINPQDCPDTTLCPGPNEEFSKCGYCHRTCDNPNPGCPKMCRVGCFCKPGYVRDHRFVCILHETCPSLPTCSGSNEVYKTCGTCDGTCDNPNPICPGVCTPGCYCTDGHVRDNTGACIPSNHCPKECTGQNEEFTTCGGCDPTCESPDLKCRIACQIGCFCKKGFVRDENNKCIDPSKCYKTTTPCYKDVLTLKIPFEGKTRKFRVKVPRK